MIGDCEYINDLAKILDVGFFIWALFGKVFHQIYRVFLWRRHDGALSRGTTIAALK